MAWNSGMDVKVMQSDRYLYDAANLGYDAAGPRDIEAFRGAMEAAFAEQQGFRWLETLDPERIILPRISIPLYRWSR